MQRLLISLSILICLSLSATASDYSFQGIGYLDNVKARSEAIAVSGDGSTVVGLSSSLNGYSPHCWTFENGIQHLPLPNGWGLEGLAVGVNRDGSVIIGEDTDERYWTEAIGWWNFMPQPMGITNRSSAGRAVSHSGDFLVTVEPIGTIDPELFLWETGSEPTSLGHLPFFPQSISDTGIIVGFRLYENLDEKAARWTPENGFELLFEEQSEEQSTAMDISANGRVIVGSIETADGWRPYRLINGRIWLLPIGIIHHALSVSADGLIIVGTTQDYRPYIWDPYSGIRFIEDELMANGVSLNGFYSLIVTDVSDDGSVVIGTGRCHRGNYEGFVITLPPVLIPANDADRQF